MRRRSRRWRSGTQLLWLAAGYQFFDGLNLGSSMCLRGVGRRQGPRAAGAAGLSLLLFVPLAHALTFAPGQGWVQFLPQFGYGAVGGWVAVLVLCHGAGQHAASCAGARAPGSGSAYR